MDSEARARLTIAAENARAFLESVWPGWHRERGVEPPVVLSSSTCGRSSTFLHRVLVEDCGLVAEVETGSGEEASGFRAGSGWASHSWVEAEGWIVDVTADQFSAPPVIVTLAGDPRYRKGCDLALPEFKAARVTAATNAWPAWLVSAQRGSFIDG